MPPSLSVTTEQLPKSQVGMTIEVPAEMVDATYERVLNRLASRSKLEGFRPGRAPRALVEARLGPAAIREEVVEAIVPEVIRQALQEKSIDPIDNPDVEVDGVDGFLLERLADDLGHDRLDHLFTDRRGTQARLDQRAWRASGPKTLELGAGREAVQDPLVCGVDHLGRN